MRRVRRSNRWARSAMTAYLEATVLTLAFLLALGLAAHLIRALRNHHPLGACRALYAVR